METGCSCGVPCIKPAPQILKGIESFFSPCNQCKPSRLKKFSPLTNQINLNEINGDFFSCNCGKRHLDIVIAHLLKIMIEEGVKDEKTSLRNACTPLITPSFTLDSAPYLPKDSVVILSPDVTRKCAQRIFNEVEEVKGVLKGDLSETVGIKDTDLDANEYELLAGCDVRCDVVQTSYGNLCIYKYQGKTHIEFPRASLPKIKILSNILDQYSSPTVIDCTCGPGTLGILCLKKGAVEVIFNDIWPPAIEMTAINLEMNGFPVTRHPEEDLLAEGKNFKLYSKDIREMGKFIPKKFDICLVDTFPGVDSGEFVEAAEKLCKKVVLI